MHHSRFLVVVPVLALVLSACGGSGSSAPPARTRAVAQVIPTVIPPNPAYRSTAARLVAARLLLNRAITSLSTGTDAQAQQLSATAAANFADARSQLGLAETQLQGAVPAPYATAASRLDTATRDYLRAVTAYARGASSAATNARAASRALRAADTALGARPEVHETGVRAAALSRVAAVERAMLSRHAAPAKRHTARRIRVARHPVRFVVATIVPTPTPVPTPTVRPTAIVVRRPVVHRVTIRTRVHHRRAASHRRTRTPRPARPARVARVAPVKPKPATPAPVPTVVVRPAPPVATAALAAVATQASAASLHLGQVQAWLLTFSNRSDPRLQAAIDDQTTLVGWELRAARVKLGAGTTGGPQASLRVALHAYHMAARGLSLATLASERNQASAVRSNLAAARIWLATGNRQLHAARSVLGIH